MVLRIKTCRSCLVNKLPKIPWPKSSEVRRIYVWFAKILENFGQSKSSILRISGRTLPHRIPWVEFKYCYRFWHCHATENTYYWLSSMRNPNPRFRWVGDSLDPGNPQLNQTLILFLRKVWLEFFNPWWNKKSLANGSGSGLVTTVLLLLDPEPNFWWSHIFILFYFGKNNFYLRRIHSACS